MRFLILLCLLAGVPALCAASSTTEYRLDMEDCPFREKGWFDPARMNCGTAVAVEPGVSEPIRVPAIRITRRDATSQAAPVVFLNGGPGGRGVAGVADWLAHPLLERHDLILYDARGTGLATPLPCPELGAGVLSLIAKDLDASTELKERTDLVGACLSAMPAPLRGVFATPHMAADIDAIRRMFGYERLSLYAVSYGTRVAMAYADTYPQHLDKLLLDSVVPKTAYYQDIGDTFEQVLQRTFAGCEGSSACNARFPRFRKDYGAILAGLRSNSLRLDVPGGGYADDTVSLNAQDFSLLMQQLFYGNQLIPTFPLMIDALKRGNSAPLGLLFDQTVGMRVKGLNLATYYLVLGNDELPMRRAAGQDTSATGDGLVFFAQDMKLLEALQMFAGSAAPAASNALAGPMLVMAGSFDPITAPSYGSVLAAGAANARYLEFPATGHTASLSDKCARKAATSFLSTGIQGASVTCMDAMPAVSWTNAVYASPWPGNWLEAIIVPRTLAPAIWLGAPLALYLLLGLWAVGRGLRRLPGRRTVAGAAPPAASSPGGSIISGAGYLAGTALLVGLCMALFQTATGSAPGALLFGLPSAFSVALIVLAMLLVAATLAMTVLSVQAMRRRQWHRRSHLWMAVVAVVNLYLIVVLLRWQVLVPA